MRLAPLLLILLGSPPSAGDGAQPSLLKQEVMVHDLNARSMATAVGHHKRLLVLMYDGACRETKAFQPWLFALADTLRHQLPVGQIDISQSQRVIAETFQVGANTPVIKVFMRENPAGKRIVDYNGPLDFDTLHEWCRSILAGEEHELTVYGYEPPEDEAVMSNAREAEQQTPFNNLPDSVRLMAQTMVREKRLLAMLNEIGGGRAERYNNMVADRYQRILQTENLAKDDKFGVQEANRKARDAVRDEILESAPDHVRDQVMQSVNLGDVAAQQKGRGAAPKMLKGEL